jgi:hypothetical protein
MEIKPFYSGRAYYDITGDNGEKYVFVPQEFVEKGFVQDGQQFYSPGFLTPGALSTASAFTLPSDSSLTGAAKSIYQNPTKGFVWKADDFNKINYDDFSIKSYQTTDTYGPIKGYTLKDGVPNYVQEPSPGANYTLLNKDGTSTNTTVTVTRSGGGGGGFFAQLGRDILSGGPLPLLALDIIGASAGLPGIGTAIAGGVTAGAIASGDEKTALNYAAQYAAGQLGVGSAVAGATGSTVAGQVAQGTAGGLLAGKNPQQALTGAVQGVALDSLRPDTGATVPTDQQALAQQQDLQNELTPYESTIPANTTAFDTTTDFPDVSGFDIPLPTPQTPITGSTGGNMATDYTEDPYGYSGTPSYFNYAEDPYGYTGTPATDYTEDPYGYTGGTGGSQVAAIPGDLNAFSGYGNLTIGQAQRLFGGGGGGAAGGGVRPLTTAQRNAQQQALGSLLGGAIGGVGGILAGQTSAKASEEQAKMISEATGRAVPGSQFRPIGTTTRFGTSQFQVDPTTGQLTSAGYQLTPELKAMQDRVMALTGQGLTEAEQAAGRYAPLTAGAQGLFGLGQQYLGTQQGAPIGKMAEQYMQSQAGQPLTNLGLGYLAKSPEEAASEYMRSQMDLLAPSRERQLSQLQNQLFNTGRGGLSVGATGVRPGGGQGLRAASPEMEAYYNALAQQDAQLAAGAQQAGQQRAQFGAGLYQQGTGLTQAQQLAGAGLYGQGVGLTQQGQQFGAGLLGSGANLLGAYGQGLTGAYAPFSTGIGVGSQLEQLGQQPLSISQQLAQLSSASGARAGELGIRGTTAAAAARLPSMQFNPLSRALVGAGGNTQFGNALGQFTGNALPDLLGLFSGGLPIDYGTDTRQYDVNANF